MGKIKMLLGNRSNEEIYTVVDKEDYEQYQLNRYKWCVHNNYGRGLYAKTNIKKHDGKHTTLYLHRLIMGNGKENVDHKDGNGLNNCRENLRMATRSQNQGNRKSNKGSMSKYKGVSFHKVIKKWCARISIKGRDNSIGYYEDEESAAIAYNHKAKEVFGEYARLNVIKNNFTGVWGGL